MKVFFKLKCPKLKKKSDKIYRNHRTNLQIKYIQYLNRYEQHKQIFFKCLYINDSKYIRSEFHTLRELT